MTRERFTPEQLTKASQRSGIYSSTDSLMFKQAAEDARIIEAVRAWTNASTWTDPRSSAMVRGACEQEIADKRHVASLLAPPPQGPRRTG